jgi:hypothetical protein
MPQNKVDFDIGTSNAERSLDSLINKARQLEMQLQRAGVALGSDPSPTNAARFFTAANQLGDAQQQVASMVQGSAQAGGPGPSPFAPLPRMQRLADPTAAAQFVMGAGLNPQAQAAAMAYVTAGTVPMMAGGGGGSGSPINPLNPFMGASPIGPASPIGTPGLNLNTYILQQQMMASQMRLQGLQALGAGALYAGAGAISSGLDYATQRTLQGGADIMGQASIFGRLAGSLLGGAAGFASGLGGLGVAGGVALGGQLGESALRWLTAPMQNTLDAEAAARPYLIGGGYTYGVNGTAPGGYAPFGRSVRFGDIADMLNRGNYLKVTSPMLGRAWAQIAEGMGLGGMNPFAPGGGNVYGTGSAEYQDAMRRAAEGPSVDNLSGIIGDSAIMALKRMGFGREQSAEAYIRRLGTLYRDDVEKGAGIVAPIFATLPETGGNPADVLARFGPEATSVFMRIQNDALIGQVPRGMLEHVSAVQRGSQRQARLGALQVRGSGAAQMAAYANESEVLATLPGGSESLAYAESQARWRGARSEAWEQADILSYGIPETRLAGALERTRLAPFMPGNVMRLQLQRMGLARQQLGVVEGRLAGGGISEREQLGLEEQRQHLLTEYYSGIAEISEGFENRLPAFFAGRPAMGMRFSSLQGAAFNLGRLGSPIRAFGAMGGHQQHDQEALFAGAGISSGPRSTTAMLNNPGAMGVLTQILQELKTMNAGSRGGSGGARHFEVDANRGARQSPYRIDQGKRYPDYP